MGKTRVYEVAKAVGLDKDELVSRINAMDLGIDVKNYMSALTEEQASLVQTTIARERRRQVVEERISPTVIRRRSRKRKNEPEEEVEAAAVDAAPEAASDVAPAPAAEAVAEATPEAVPAPVEAAETPAEVAEVAAAPTEPEEASVEATADAPATTAPAAPVEPAKPAAPDAPAEPAPVAAVVAPPKPGTPGASNIAGFIDPEVIRKRLAKDNKTFAPGPARAADRRPGKPAVADKAPRRKVVSQRDLYGGPGQRRRRRAKGGSRNKKQTTGERTQITQAAEHKRVLRIADTITVGDLAHEMGVKSSELIKLAMGLGMMMTVNHPIDVETAEMLATEFGFTVTDVSFKEENFTDDELADDAEDLEFRAPVVTVMGHVDHGKTSLLDAIRDSTVTAGEAGGITQHIGASSVDTAGGRVVFLDTPGHEAFTALRQRGAKVTDLVVLVVAADDGVMPQTVEALNHARAAEVPIIVAVNKIDKPGANPQRVKQALTEYELIPEEWGGSTIFVEVSALEATNIDSLIELIHLQSEVLELKANPNKRARGVVLEAFKDIGRGTVANLIVQEGTLKDGDIVVSGGTFGRVRTICDELGNALVEAPPSTPIEITGLSAVPEAGEVFFVAEDEKTAKAFTDEIIARRRQSELAARKVDPWAALKLTKTLNVIVKADVQGSVEALEQSLLKLATEEVGVKVIHSGAGGITESDIQLAVASEALIIGFNVRPETRAAEIAKREGVEIELASVIYDVLDKIRFAMTGLLEPVFEEQMLGEAEVRETFNVPKVGTVAGCYIIDGKILRGAKARLIRDNKVIYESKISTLRRFKDDVKEVKSGFECGLSLENYNDVRLEDRIEVFEMIEVQPTLDG